MANPLIFVFENTTPSLKGDASRWLLPITSQVYIAFSITSGIRQRLIDRFSQHIDRYGGGLTIIQVDITKEQGFSVIQFGQTRWFAIDFDGITLMARRPNNC